MRVRKVADPIIVVGDEKALAAARRVVIYATYFEGHELRYRDRRFVSAFLEAGYSVVLVQASSSGPKTLSWGEGELPERVVLISRSNFGYDFGSWSIGMKRFPFLAKMEFVLLTNDSIVGPFAGLEGILQKFETSNADVWSATMNNQFFPHLQSYFMGFRKRVLADRPLRQFWRGIRVEANKDDVVMKYELGLTRLLFSEAYVFDCALPSRVLVDYDQNPSLQAWDRMMLLGFPYLKKMVIEQPELAWNSAAAKQFIQEQYRQDLEMWLA